jgi:UDP-glucose 4-epimerase
MRVLVTGAAGYVGRAVVRELRARGHLVVALVHRSSATFPADVETRRGDLHESLRELAADIDGVVHLAARSTVRDSVTHPTRAWRTNVAGTLNLLEALPAAARLVFASTGSVYGRPAQQPISESAAIAPLNPYGSSKAAAEQLIAAQAATGALGAVTVRLFNAAGAVDGRADEDPTRIIPRVAAVAAGVEPVVTVNGDGSAVRDFVHVCDIAVAVALGLEAATPGQHKIYNLGAVPASVADIVEAMTRISGQPVKVEHHPANPHEAPELRADTSRIRAELGWAPTRTTIDELVADQWTVTDR